MDGGVSLEAILDLKRSFERGSITCSFFNFRVLCNGAFSLTNRLTSDRVPPDIILSSNVSF